MDIWSMLLNYFALKQTDVCHFFVVSSRLDWYAFKCFLFIDRIVKMFAYHLGVVLHFAADLEQILALSLYLLRFKNENPMLIDCEPNEENHWPPLETFQPYETFYHGHARSITLAGVSYISMFQLIKMGRKYINEPLYQCKFKFLKIFKVYSQHCWTYLLIELMDLNI